MKLFPLPDVPHCIQEDSEGPGVQGITFVRVLLYRKGNMKTAA